MVTAVHLKIFDRLEGVFALTFSPPGAARVNHRQKLVDRCAHHNRCHWFGFTMVSMQDGIRERRKKRHVKVSFISQSVFALFLVACMALWAIPFILFLDDSNHENHHSKQNLRHLEAPVVVQKTATWSVESAPKKVKKTPGAVSTFTNASSYTSALATLSCFSTPGCFPSSKCYTGEPQKLQRQKEWEEQSFCVEDLKASKDCLVYSFGIEHSTEWEEKVAKQFQCEVHAFDPTMNHDTNIAPGVTFHKLGLQADGTDMSSNAVEYDEIDTDLLLTLPEITKRLGHENRTIDVLMLDCEGCEWGVLRTLACSKQSHLVKQLVTEFHYQKNLGLRDEEDVHTAAAAIECLWEERWHVVSMELSGAGSDNWEYAKGVSSILHGKGMLLYLALERIPENRPTPALLLEDYIQAANILKETDKGHRAKYGQDQSRWPMEANAEVSNFKKVWRAKKSLYRQVASDNVEFKKYGRYQEEGRRDIK